ncbi:uncharacterized protein LOC132302793 [Cornus florida]|uniref:uncharacterized protein LOC132302793 n=1 Tax=Cornus florida TaxID=4283 RepID=UPI00289D741B|nr:uncharacterized protein LOC132302793 [Cornus florida]XP_059655724.1 uncharacterized protein LOC132302793 [Cornus florida]
MGFKRPFDEEAFQEAPFKHARQYDRGLKLISYTDIFPFPQAPQKTDIPGEGEEQFYKFGLWDELENDNANMVSNIADAEFEISDPFSWITSSTSEENAGSGAVVCSGPSPEYFDSNFSRRSLVKCKDTHSSLLDCSPTKQVPLGPNHQAEVPVWDLQVTEKHSLVSDHITDDDRGKDIMGTCVIPFPDFKLHAHGGLKAGDGRIDCCCLDAGSVRCIRQHVMEARERMRETLGHEKFVELGLYDTGEEVAQKWTDEEEELFHEVIYSNPFSLGRNFWKLLSAMFPSRTKRELVSYYFNVFMLRKRAAQNRSRAMDIDSDDDEWQGTDGHLFGVPEAYEDTAIKSFVYQDFRVDEEDDYLDDDDDHDNGGDSDDSTGNNGNNCAGDTVMGDDGRIPTLKEQSCRTLDDSRFDLAFHHTDSVGDDNEVLHVPCVSFERHPSTVKSCCSGDVEGAIQERGVNNDYEKCLFGHGD